MAQRSYPFDGAPIAEAEWTLMARHWLGDGVIAGELNQLEVFGDSTGMQVKLRTGRAWVKGHYYENDAELTLTVTTANGTNPRIDRVVLRLDWTANSITAVVKAGTPAASPVAPALTQNASTWEISLAQILVGAGASTITAGNVTNERTYAAARLVNGATGAILVPWHAGNDGAGSGLDADLLDGLNSAQFVRSDIAQTIAQPWNFTQAPTFNGGPLWNAANDGAGSGLDADTVDGVHAAGFSAVGHSHAHSHAEYLLLAGGSMTGPLTIEHTLTLSGSLRVDITDAAVTVVAIPNMASATGRCIIVRNESGTIIGYIPLVNLS